MKMTKNQRFMHAFPVGKFTYLIENKYQFRCNWVENTPTPPPFFAVKLWNCETFGGLWP
jgi:hypothetical protein